MHDLKGQAQPAQSLLHALFVLAASLLCSGCGGNLPETAPVRGVVTFNGKPLSGFKNAAVIFTPTNGRPAKSVISPTDSTFELTTYKPGDGARLGRHSVAVSATVDDPSDKDDRYPGVRLITPHKFGNGDTSGLTYEVESGKNNQIEIQLHSNGTGAIVAK
jgi:hypothetical protein